MQPLQNRHRLAAAHPRAGQRPHRYRSNQTAVVDAGRRRSPLDPHQLAQGNQQAGATAHLQRQQIGSITAGLTLQLHNYPAHLATFKAIIYIITTKTGANSIYNSA